MIIKNKNTSGFTLIELLVVIAIIGMLSSVILASLNSARAKGRDARRMADLREVQKALEMYYHDHNAYPSTGSGWWGNCSTYGSHTTSGSNGYVPSLAPDYIPQLPLDPKPVGTNGCYLYRSNGTDYMLLAHVTVETFDPDTGPHPLDRPCCDQQSISVYSPGARTW